MERAEMKNEGATVETLSGKGETYLSRRKINFAIST